MKKHFLLLPAFLLLCSSSLQAQIDSLQTKKRLTISGYIDTYYQYNINKPVSGFSTGRIFDLPHNNFSLGLVQIVFTYSANKLTVVADLTFGPNADLCNFGNEGTARLIKQAYIAYNFTDQLTFTIGQLSTHIGYELIEAPLNNIYSLSYLFGNGPFYHTGAKLNFALNEQVGLMLGIINGWDALKDFNNKKSIAAQLSLSPPEGLNVYLNWIGGDEHDPRGTFDQFNSFFGNTEGSYTSLFNLTTSYQITNSLLIGLNAAYGSFTSGSSIPEVNNPWSEDANWGGTAIYLYSGFNDMLGMGLRGEYFSDPEGVRYFGPLKVNILYRHRQH